MTQPYIFETLVGLGEAKDKPVTIWTQVVTNRPHPTERKLYDMLMELREDNHLIAAELKLKRKTGRAFRIKSIGENYKFLLMQGRIIRAGYDYRLEMIKLKEKDEMGNVEDLVDETQLELLKERIHGATRSWSTSTSTNILYVFKDGKVLPWYDFDDTLGLFTGNGDKFSKRAAEYIRVTELGIELDAKHVAIELYEGYDNPEDYDFIGVDGHFVISEKLFFKILGRVPDKNRRAQMLRAYEKGDMVSFNGRILCEIEGIGPCLIKGDCHVVPNKQLEAKYGYVPDVVTHKVNCKTEIGTKDNTVTITLNPYHPHHIPNVSSQLLSWGMDFFVENQRLMDDYTSMVNEFVTAVSNGQFPKHLMNAAPPHDEDDVFSEVGYINALHDSTYRWLASGMKLTHSSYLVAQHVGGFKLKHDKAIIHLRMPLPWATLAHCVTVAILEMGNWDLSGYDTSKMFWHAPTGRMCWPTQDFINNYHRHGGHDQDDSHTTALRAKKVDSGDNPNVIWNLGGEDWCIKAVNTRSPNGLSYFGQNDLPGEYSILDIDLGLRITNFGFIDLPTMNFPLYNVWEGIPGIDMDNAPQITHVQEIGGDLPTDDYNLKDHSYSPEDAVRQMMLAMENPGIGQIINPIIAYAAIFGTYPKKLPAYLEQMVDAAEQTPSFAAFKKILEAKADLLISIQHHTKRPVDHYIAKRRVPSKVRKVLQSQDRITKDGPYTKLIEHMKGVVEQAMEIMVGNRHRNPVLRTKGINITQRQIIQELMDVEVSREATVAAHDLNRFFNATKKNAPQFRFDQDPASEIRVRRNDPYLSYARRQYFIALNNECVKRITEHEVPTRELMVAIYQMIINENLEDDLIFQLGEAGKLNSVMDLFMKVLWDMGIITEILDPENIDVMGTLG